MKRILIIGAGFLQSFVIQTAKRLGYYTLAVDKNPNAVGFRYADECSVIDIVDQDACLKYAVSRRIDGVMTAATDYGVLTAAYIAREMNLPGLDYEVAKTIKNKYKVRSVLSQNKIDDISQFYEIRSLDELNLLRSNIRFPVMVKPCDGSGSKAIRRVDNIYDLPGAIEEAIEASLIGSALIEDFVEGKEYGLEAFVYDGEVSVLAVIGKRMTAPPYYAELGHCIPSNLDIEDEVKAVARCGIEMLGINFGAVNMDVLVTEDGRVCIVDIGARMGGNLIGSHIVPCGVGVDYMENLIRAAVADEVNVELRRAGKQVATRILALTPGKVKELPDFGEISRNCQVQIYHSLKKGDVIHMYQNNLHGCGYIVAVAEDVDLAEKRAETARRLIDLTIVRE